jgi:HK97 gp10 family phage protein
MTTRATLTLEGLDDYLELLKKAGEDIDRVAEEGLLAGGDMLVSGMQSRAPFSRIANAVRRTSIMKDGNKRYLYVGVLRGTDAETARIANVWEFGGRTTPSPKNRSRHPRPGIQARPFMRPTLRRDAKKAQEALVNVFQNWLKG